MCILIIILIIFLIFKIKTPDNQLKTENNYKFENKDNSETELINVKLAEAGHHFKRINENQCKDDSGNIYNFNCWYCAVASPDYNNNPNTIKIKKDNTLLGFIPEDKLKEYYNNFGNLNKDVVFILHYYEDENIIYGTIHFPDH